MDVTAADSPSAPLSSGDLSEVVAKLVGRLDSIKSEYVERLSDLEKRLGHVELKLASTGSLRVGEVVRIDGLDNVAHLHLNGKKAQLRRWEGPGGRWQVQVMQTQEMKSLKVDNLISAPTAVFSSGDPFSAGTDVTDPVGGRGAESSLGATGMFGNDGRGGLSMGDVAEICNLRRQSQLNGTRAELLSWDDVNGRWLVRLKGQVQPKRLRPVNLRRVGEAVRLPSNRQTSKVSVPERSADGIEAGVLVRLQGLNTQALNGARARIKRWDAQACRWVVHLLEKDEEKSLRAENLVEIIGMPRAGQIARIEGLEQAAHLNGLLAEVLRWDVDRGRWAVNVILQNQEKFLRPESLSVIPDGALRSGCSTIIQGVDEQEINCHRATLLHWAKSDLKWHVRVDGTGQEKRLRPRQLRVDSSSGRADDNMGVDVSGASRDVDIAEILGDSDDDMDDDCADDAAAFKTSADGLHDGAEAFIVGGAGADAVYEGRRATLIRWEDVGGPFGQWVVRVQGSGESLTLHPSCLSAVGVDELK